MGKSRAGIARPDGKRAMWASAVMVAAAFAVAALLWPSQVSAGGYTGPARVNVTRLNLRKGPSNQSMIVAVLRKGDAVQVMEVSGSWCSVTASGGKKGWCSSRSLSFGTVAAKDRPPTGFALLDTQSAYIDLSKTFTFQRCMADMDEIAAAYPGRARVATIGHSAMGNPVNAIVLGNPAAGSKILVQASMHARECITALLALRQAECMLKADSNGAVYRNVKVADLLDDVEVWVVPMSNPDGVRLVYEGLGWITDAAEKSRLKAMNRGSSSFYHWKANARGVDLNRNFGGSHWAIDPMYPKPGLQNYAGLEPFSEPEARALRDLTVAQDFCLTMSYHSSGKMIYWYDENDGPTGVNRRIADDLSSLNRYRVLPVYSQAPNGGYRDWYVEESGKPGFTMEIGSGYCPLPLSSFGGIWGDNRFILYELAWLTKTMDLAAN
jgi:uncharacterized protein YgiM (DUF1202 family)